MNNSKVHSLFLSNPLAWGMYYLGERFRDTSPPFHLKVLREAMGSRRFACAAPRESAKSTIVAYLLPLHRIVFGLDRFIVLVSNTFKKGGASLENIKTQIRDNKMLKRDFGVTITKDAEGDSVFRHPNGMKIRFLCKGCEQIGSIRGEIFNDWRPTLVILDDVEDDEMVKNAVRRAELKDVFDEALVPAADRKVGRIWAIGTILHDDGLMAKLVSPNQYPEYRKLLYRAKNVIGGEKISLWPEKWTVEELEKMELTKPSVFAKEYQNDPVSGTVGKFTKDEFHYWKIIDRDYVLFDKDGDIISRGSLLDCKAGISNDLAWSEKRTSDDTVIMPGFLTPDGEILIDRYIKAKGMKPDRFADNLFLMEERLHKLTGSKVVIGFEKAMLEKVTKWLLGKEMRRRNTWLWLKDLPWVSDKIARIETTLQPRYAQGAIYHLSSMGDLEYQLLRFPSGSYDDLIDAEQGLCRLLEFPKERKKKEVKEDHFSWLRRKHIEKRDAKGAPYIFGHKGQRFGIPATESYA